MIEKLLIPSVHNKKTEGKKPSIQTAQAVIGREPATEASAARSTGLIPNKAARNW